MALLIPATGPAREVTPANGDQFTLEELHRIVGGYIEALRAPDDRIMFLNEDGKRLGLQKNDKATALGWAAGTLSASDVVVGDVIVCDEREAGETDEPDA